MSIFEKFLKRKSNSELFDEGIAKINSKAFDEAIQDFNLLIKRDSSNALAYCNRGLCKIHKDEWDNGIKDIKIAEKLGLSYASELLKQFVVENRSEIKFVSDDVFNKLQTKSNQFSNLSEAENYYERAVNSGENGCDGDALKFYNKAIELNPNFLEALYNRGNTYFRLQEYALALKDYDKFISINSNLASVYHNRGVTKQYLDDKVGCCKDIKKAIELGDNVYAINSFNQFCR